MLLLSMACKRSKIVEEINAGNSEPCGEAVKISNSLEDYTNAASATFAITQAAVSGDCLTITVSSSGCDGKTWQANLLDAGVFPQTVNAQRDLKVTLINKEGCTAVPGRIFSFDIYPLRMKNTHQVQLNLTGYHKSLLYSY